MSELLKEIEAYRRQLSIMTRSKMEADATAARLSAKLVQVERDGADALEALSRAMQRLAELEPNGEPSGLAELRERIGLNFELTEAGSEEEDEWADLYSMATVLLEGQAAVYDFAWAVKRMREGKTVKRRSDGYRYHLSQAREDVLIRVSGDYWETCPLKNIHPSDPMLAATDWEVVDEPCPAGESEALSK